MKLKSNYLKTLYFLLLAPAFLIPDMALAKKRRHRTEESEENKPSQLKIADKVKDFGVVKRGQKLSWSIEFTNKGPLPLVIQGVHTSCGCVATQTAEGKSYQAGESGKIDVTLDTSDYRGSLDKTVSILTDVKTDSGQTVHLKADVKEELTANPPLVDFGDLRLGDQAEKVVTIKALEKFDLVLDKVSFNEKILEVKQEKIGDAWQLRVKLKGDVVNGFLKETIIVSNNSPSLKQLRIPVRGNIQGNITISPNYLEFGAIEGKTSARKAIELEAVKEFQLIGSQLELNVNGSVVSAADRMLKVDLGKSDGGRNRKVTVELSNMDGMSGSVHGRVTLLTSDPLQKNVTVDFYAMFQP